MNRRTAGPLFVLALLSSSARAGHQDATLQSAANQLFVRFETSGNGPLAVDSPDGAGGRFSLLDLDIGHLWNGDAVAFRLRDGRFLTLAAGGDLRPAAAQLAIDAATGLNDLAAAQRFLIEVSEPSGFCPGALVVPTPTPAAPFPPLSPTALINDGCLVSFRSLDGTRELFVDGAGAMGSRPLGSWPAVASNFRLRLAGSPPPMTLSAPFLELNRFVPFAVHVDHRRHPPSGPGLRCENSDGIAPPEPHGRPCYPGHEGTDFIVRPISVGPGLTVADIRVVAAAPGIVAAVPDGNFDRCYLNPAANCVLTAPLPPGVPSLRCPQPGDYASYITCNGAPSGGPGTGANGVVVVQDDGLVAEYFHLKNGSPTVKVGQRVECGEVLGLVGSSGTSSLPHLHFDLSKLPNLELPRPTDEFDRTPQMPLGPGINQGSPLLVDPYDYHDALGRATMWTDLVDTWPSKLPRLVCQHSSQAQSTLAHGLSDGSPCQSDGQCRPLRVCSSDLICEQPRAPGGACREEKDCQAFSACENGVCTRRGLAPGMACGTGLLCGPGLTCDNGRCRLLAAQPPECPPHTSKRCPPGCSERNGECRTNIGNRGCERVCLP